MERLKFTVKEVSSLSGRIKVVKSSDIIVLGELCDKPVY